MINNLQELSSEEEEANQLWNQKNIVSRLDIHDPKEVLQLCEETINAYDLSHVAKTLIEEGGWEGTCREQLVSFVQVAEKALPNLAEEVIRLQKENVKLSQALEKQTPKKVVGQAVKVKALDVETEQVLTYPCLPCPSCVKWITQNNKYCAKCGQLLDWSQHKD